MSRIAIVGAGSFGTALAVHLCGVGHAVRLWAREPAFAEVLERERRNPVYLPDVALPPGVEATGDLVRALEGAAFVVAAVPSHGLRAVMSAAGAHLPADAIVVSTTKGLEEGTLLRMSELLREVLGPQPRIAALSGPSFAVEVARGLPTALVVASGDETAVTAVQREFRGPYLRLYGSADVVGVELGGALKNVIAIASGAVEGMGLGPNAGAALITRGLAEITRLACAFGARRDTLAGLAGLGDLVLTCTGALSRNRQVGVALAAGRPLAEIVGGTKMVAEGVRTTGAALALGARAGVELPIACQVAAVLDGRTDARTALEELMVRRQRPEADEPG